MSKSPLSHTKRKLEIMADGILIPFKRVPQRRMTEINVEFDQTLSDVLKGGEVGEAAAEKPEFARMTSHLVATALHMADGVCDPVTGAIVDAETFRDTTILFDEMAEMERDLAFSTVVVETFPHLRRGFEQRLAGSLEELQSGAALPTGQAPANRATRRANKAASSKPSTK